MAKGAATSESLTRAYLARIADLDRKGPRLNSVIALKPHALGRSPQTDAVFEQALSALKAAGAVLVDVTPPDGKVIDDLEDLVLRFEFNARVNAYLASTAHAQVKTRTLAELIDFNAAEPRETELFGQEIFLEAQASPDLDDPAYLKARADAKRLAGPEGIDKLLRDAKVEVLVAESGGPASVVDRINGGRWLGSPSTLPAVAGYPHLTGPMGFVEGLPVGLSFIGTAWSEVRLLSLGYAFE